MTTDSHDPRISKILHLVSQLTDYACVMNGETNDGDGDDLDCIVERLTAIVDQHNQRQQKRDEIETRFETLLETIDTITSPYFSSESQVGPQSDIFQAALMELKTIVKELEFLIVPSSSLQRITDALPDSIIITDQDGKITMVNKAVCRLLAYQESELLAQPINSLFVEQFRIDAPDSLDSEERTIIAKDGRQIPVACSRSHLRNDQGQPMGIICVAQDITDRKPTEETLKLFQYSIDQSTDAIFWMTRDAGFLYVNEQACRSLCYSREELLGLKLVDIDPLYSKARWDASWEQRRESRQGRTRYSESLHRRKDGSTFPIEISSTPIWLGDQELHVAVCRDITERKRAEEALHLTQFSVDHASIGIMRTGSEAQILSVNQYYCQLLGYTAEELCNMHVYDIDPYFPLERWEAHRTQIRRHGSDTFETVHRRKDGTMFPVEITATYISYQGNEFSFSFIHDITERKQMIEAMRLTSFAVEHVSDAVYWIDSDTIIRDVNEAACLLFGYSREEFIGKSVAVIDPEKTLDEIKKLWQKIKDEGTLTFETAHQTQDGHVFPVEVVVIHVSHEGTELNCAFARDITQRKQAEKELRQNIAQREHTEEILKESQAVLQAILESMEDGLLVITKGGAVSHYNSSFCQMWAIPENLMAVGNDQVLIDYVLPQLVEPEQFTARIEDVYETTDTSEDILHLRGGRLFERTSYPLIRDDQETGRVWLFRDITERRQAEEALRESEHLLRVSQSVARLGSYYFDIKSGTWISSPALDEEVFGIPDNYPKTVDGWITLVHPDDQEEMFNHLTDHVLKKHHPFKKEYRIIRHSDQQERWVLGLGELEFDESGAPIKMIGTIQDITERKRAEIALQESEQKFRAVVQHAQAIIFILDSNGVFMLSEGQALGSLGLAPNQVVGMSALEFYHDNPPVLDGIKRAMTGELVHVMSEVQGIVFDVVYSPYYDLENKVVGVVGIAIDITERRHAELKLQERNRFIDAILENAPIGFAVNTIDDGQVVLVSPKFSEIYGHSSHGMDTIDIFFEKVYPDPAFREQMRERILTDIASGDVSRMRWEDIPITTSAGEQRVVTATNIPLWEQNLMISTVQDVTERKQAEKALRLNSFVVERTSDAVYWIDYDTRIVDVNDGACRLLGYSREELIGRLFGGDIDPEFNFDTWPENWERVKVGNFPPFEALHRAKDGRIIPVEIVTNYIAFEGQELHCAFARDVTERKQAEKALRLNSFVVERSSDAVYWINSDAQIVDVNEAACRMLGYSREELTGMSLVEIDPVFDFDTWPDIWEQVVTGDIPPLETLHQAKDGRNIPVEVMANYIVFEGKEFNCAFARDITERKQVEKALRQSEARHRALIESQVDLISRYRPDTTLTFVNDAYCQFYGKTREELIGQSYLTMVAPEFREITRKEAEDLVKNPRLISGEYLNYAADGSARWIQWVVQCIVDESGQVIELQAVGRDITRLKETEAALQASEERAYEFQEKLKALHEVSLKLVTTESIDKLCCRAIELGQSVLGYDRIGILLFENAEQSKVSRYGIESTGELRVEHGMNYNAETDIVISPILTNRELVYVSEDTPLSDFETEIGRGWNVISGIWDGNTCIGWMATDNYFKREPLIPYQVELLKLYGLTVGHLVTRKRAEAAIRILNDELEQRVLERTKELEEANEDIRHFAYIVSHDLRAPLVNLKGFAAELRSDLKIVKEGFDNLLSVVDPAQRDRVKQALQDDIPEALHFIESSVSNMDTFTKAILKLSRLGRLHLELIEVDIGSLVKKMLETLSYQINQQGIRVTIGDLPAITADLVSMEQIFSNILTNAVTYLDPERPGEIDISAEQIADGTIFRIRDNGRGIEEEDTDKVFAPFRRAGKQDMPGEGMGLAYVQTLVRRHGGRIWFESESGIGTTFAFIIPSGLKNITAGT